MAPLRGGCACGAVRYEATADPVFMLNCHCRDCQRATGGGYAPIAVFPAAAFRIAGDVRRHGVTGGSGGQVERGFCGTCGSPLTINLAAMPTIMCVVAGSLDDPSVYRPEADSFTASAHGWDHMDPVVKKFAGPPGR